MIIHVNPTCISHNISISLPSFSISLDPTIVVVKSDDRDENGMEKVEMEGRRQEKGRERENVRDILLSAIESDRISARSRKTRQRSLSTWMRGLISRYSRTAW